MLDNLKPWLRFLKYNWLQFSAEYQAQQVNITHEIQLVRPVAFLIGCGRSGTTILGHLLSKHIKVNYLFEPYHLWAAVDPKTDVLHLFHRVEADLLMNEYHYTQTSQLRFNQLFIFNNFKKNSKIIIEKTPLNSMRVGYLNALCPTAKFIHIVRDGIDVAYSIERLASTNSYKIAGKPQLNQWWGVENYKLKALLRDGSAAGYYSDEVHLLQDHCSQGAYEWLVSLGEVDRWRKQLGSRLYEITYNQLTTSPETALQNICEFLELDSPTNWLKEAREQIKLSNSTIKTPLSLPPGMCASFNHYQEKFSFLNRSICKK